MSCAQQPGSSSARHAGEQQPAAWQAGISLPPELQTGHPVIDFEHTHLLYCIRGLRQVCDDMVARENCQACDERRQRSCENDLVLHLGDLIAFILDHFRHEESIMHGSLMDVIDHAVCEAHMEDHAAISAKVQQITAAIERTRLVSLIRDLDTLLGNWTINHIRLHDMILVSWLDRQNLRAELPADSAI